MYKNNILNKILTNLVLVVTIFNNLYGAIRIYGAVEAYTVLALANPLVAMPLIYYLYCSVRLDETAIAITAFYVYCASITTFAVYCYNSSVAAKSGGNSNYATRSVEVVFLKDALWFYSIFGLYGIIGDSVANLYKGHDCSGLYWVMPREELEACYWVVIFIIVLSVLTVILSVSTLLVVAEALNSKSADDVAAVDLAMKYYTFRWAFFKNSYFYHFITSVWSILFILFGAGFVFDTKSCFVALVFFILPACAHVLIKQQLTYDKTLLRDLTLINSIILVAAAMFAKAFPVQVVFNGHYLEWIYNTFVVCLYPTAWMVVSTLLCYLFITVIAVVVPFRLYSALKSGLFYGRRSAVVEFSVLVYVLALNTVLLSSGRSLVVWKGTKPAILSSNVLEYSYEVVLIFSVFVAIIFFSIIGRVFRNLTTYHLSVSLLAVSAVYVISVWVNTITEFTLNFTVAYYWPGATVKIVRAHLQDGSVIKLVILTMLLILIYVGVELNKKYISVKSNSDDLAFRKAYMTVVCVFLTFIATAVIIWSNDLMIQVLMLEAISFLFVGVIVGTGLNIRAIPPIVAKYFMLSSVATAFNIFGAALLFREVGSLAYVDIYKFVRELSSHEAPVGDDNYVKFILFVSFACLFAKISLGLKVFPFSQIVPEIGSALNYYGLYLYTVVFTFPYIVAFANICKIGIVGSANASFVYMTILFSLTLIFGAVGLSSYPSALKVYFSYSAVFSGATVSIITFCSVFNHGMAAAAFFYYFTTGLATAAVFGYLVSLTTVRAGALSEIEFVTQLRFVREYFASGGLTFVQKFAPFLGLVMAAGLPPFPIFFIKISYYAVLMKHDFYILLILSVMLSVFLIFYNYRLAAIIIEESFKKEDSFASRSFGANYHLYDHCKISRIIWCVFVILAAVSIAFIFFDFSYVFSVCGEMFMGEFSPILEHNSPHILWFK